MSVQSVSAIVLGGHGDDMVPVRSLCHVGGVPVEKLIPAARLDAIERARPRRRRRDRQSAEDVGLLLAGARRDPHGRGVSVRRKQVLPCAALLEGEYGVNGFYVGVPVQIGGGGVETVVEIELTAAEQPGARRVGAATCASSSRPRRSSCRRLAAAGRSATMNIHEFQAKAVLKRYGVAVPRRQGRDNAGRGRGDRARVRAVVRRQGADPCRRARQGGRREGLQDARRSARVRARHARQDAGHASDRSGGTRGAAACSSSRAATSRASSISAWSSTAAAGWPTLMASSEGGVEIEEVAARSPEKILREPIDPAVGLQAFQARKLAFGLGMPKESVNKAVAFINGLYRAFVESDCSMAEINPLVLTKPGDLLALDAKMGFDDNALFRHADIRELRDLNEEDPREVEASKFDLSYISLDGNIGCMVNGAGLAMSTMDIIKHYGGEPANFLDVGGGATDGEGDRGLQDHPVRPARAGGAGQHLRRHHEVRRHRHRRGRGGAPGPADASRWSYVWRAPTSSSASASWRNRGSISSRHPTWPMPPARSSPQRAQRDRRSAIHSCCG